MEYRYGGGSRQRGSGTVLGLARRIFADCLERHTRRQALLHIASVVARIVGALFCESPEALREILERRMKSLGTALNSEAMRDYWDIARNFGALRR